MMPKSPPTYFKQKKLDVKQVKEKSAVVLKSFKIPDQNEQSGGSKFNTKFGEVTRMKIK